MDGWHWFGRFAERKREHYSIYGKRLGDTYRSGNKPHFEEKDSFLKIIS